MAFPTEKLPYSLLLVDDRDDVLRALERFMSLYFEQVFVAQTPTQAEQVLNSAQVDCLLCDYWLGESEPLATVLVARWRKAHPGLRRVAIMSGTKPSSIPPCPAVDRIFSKPLDMATVLRFFAELGGA